VRRSRSVTARPWRPFRSPVDAIPPTVAPRLSAVPFSVVLPTSVNDPAGSTISGCMAGLKEAVYEGLKPGASSLVGNSDDESVTALALGPASTDARVSYAPARPRPVRPASVMVKPFAARSRSTSAAAAAAACVATAASFSLCSITSKSYTRVPSLPRKVNTHIHVSPGRTEPVIGETLSTPPKTPTCHEKRTVDSITLRNTTSRRAKPKWATEPKSICSVDRASSWPGTTMRGCSAEQTVFAAPCTRPPSALALVLDKATKSLADGRVTHSTPKPVTATLVSTPRSLLTRNVNSRSPRLSG
jgi:hypothetical protein